jgi:hypothetical protein
MTSTHNPLSHPIHNRRGRRPTNSDPLITVLNAEPARQSSSTEHRVIGAMALLAVAVAS